jgi:hypothetical protein
LTFIRTPLSLTFSDPTILRGLTVSAEISSSNVLCNSKNQFFTKYCSLTHRYGTSLFLYKKVCAACHPLSVQKSNQLFSESLFERRCHPSINLAASSSSPSLKSFCGFNRVFNVHARKLKSQARRLNGYYIVPPADSYIVSSTSPHSQFYPSNSGLLKSQCLPTRANVSRQIARSFGAKL